LLFALAAVLASTVPMGPAPEALPLAQPAGETTIADRILDTAATTSDIVQMHLPGGSWENAGPALQDSTISPSSLTGTVLGSGANIASGAFSTIVGNASEPTLTSAGHAAPAALAPLTPAAAHQAAATEAAATDSSVSAAALVGPVVAVDPAALPNLQGVHLLRQLAVQPRSELARFLAGNGESVRTLLAAPPSATAVTSWWKSVPPATKHTIAQSAPELVGNLNGIPFADRSTANSSLLVGTLRQLESQLDADLGRAELGETVRRIDALQDIRGALGDGNSKPQRYLLSLDLSSEPTAAISVGNPQKADYVSFLIPGMFFNSGSQISEWTDTAARLYDEQVSWLQLLNEGNEAHETVAAVAWVGYQTPHLLNVGSLDLARQGRDALTGMVEGLQSSRGADQPYLSILAHSYGSTAALLALEENDFWVDALAVIGSPGSASQSVGELNVRNGNMFVGEAAWDPIPNSSYFGSDPGAASYGAKRMNVAGGFDVIRQNVLAPSNGHNEYFGPGTESLRNLALIGIDQGALVTDGTEKDQERTIALAQ
jgi:hypothetical protein